MSVKGRENNSWPVRTLGRAMLAHAWDGAEPRFVLHVGDFVYTGDTVGQWHPHFFDPAAALLRGTPLFTAIGNHEYRVDGSPGEYRDLFSVPPVKDAAQRWYSFDYAGCHFVSLDTNTAFAQGTTQWNWLVGDLGGGGATWKFVLLHCPPYTHSGAHKYDDADVTAVREELAEKVFNKAQYGVDAVFGGHNHFYEHSFVFYDGSETEGVHCIVTGGGGADGNHDPMYQWDPEDPPNPARHCADEQLNRFHYCTVDVPGGSGKPVLKQWRHIDSQPPELRETVTLGEPPPGW